MTRVIESLALFQRICILPHCDTSLENYFQFELSPYPLSLFDETDMWKTRKSEPYPIWLECNVHLSSNDKFVIDGDFLLHHVMWTRGKTFNETATTYVFYIQRHFGSNCHTVLLLWRGTLEKHGALKSIYKMCAWYNYIWGTAPSVS